MSNSRDANAPAEPRSSWLQRLRQRFTPTRDRVPRLNLALQGGGAHGAFTWGVLDALLEDGRMVFTAASGASAGAMNAVVLAHGLAGNAHPRAAHEHAREALHTFWTRVGSTTPYAWLTHGSGEHTRLSALGQWALQWTQWLSPQQVNPLGVNPLRDTLDELVDFERLRRASPLRLFISTTHANSGRLHVHNEREVSLDVVLASACLPMLQAPVMLDGEPHWDGGYTANPPLLPLVVDADTASDTLLVPLVPMQWTDTPQTVPEIRQRLSELAFNGRFVAELQMLARWQQDLRSATRTDRIMRGQQDRRLAHARWHVVDGATALASLRTETRAIAHAPFLEHLRDLGRAHAAAWLTAHAHDVGQRSSCDLLSLLGSRA